MFMLGRSALLDRAFPRGAGSTAAAASLTTAAACRRRRCRAAAAAASSTSQQQQQQQQQQQLAADAAARAFQAPPHSGYHFDGSPRRFFEGWYFKLDLPPLDDDGAGSGGAGGGSGSGGGHRGKNDSLALIYSVEDPGDASSDVRGVGMQVMGPGDGYVCQFSRDTRLFWADDRRLALGACLRPQPQAAAAPAPPPPPAPRSIVPPEAFDAAVLEGYQASTTWHQGRIVADERGCPGAALSNVRSAEWCFSVRPRRGWGGSGGAGVGGGAGGGGSFDSSSSSCAKSGSSGRPLATAGWLSAVPLFEPHWQVLMADGLATGWVRWGSGGSGGSSGGGGDGDGGKVRHFVDAPFYAEKNWGGGFPSKWIWLQCNNFRGAPGVSLTAVGARRALLVPGAGTSNRGGGSGAAAGGDPNAAPAANPLGALVGGLLGGEEDVGMIGVHLPADLARSRGLPDFLELVPWRGDVEWSAAPWGRWWLRARDDELEAVVEAWCDAAAQPGTILRAPTGARGFAPACRDTWGGRVRLRVWRRRRGWGVIDNGGGAGGGDWGAGYEDDERNHARAPLVDVSSDYGALEVGGGPWVGEWSARAEMREPFRSLVRLPLDVGALRDALPSKLRPPGL